MSAPRTLLVAAALLTGIGCSRSGLNNLDTDTGPAEPAPTCTWGGTWTLTEVLCGSFAYAAWDDSYDATTMVLGDCEEPGCTVAFTWSNAECEETETWVLEAEEAGDVDITYEGVGTCAPDACVFDAADIVPCAIGDRVGAGTVSMDDTEEGKLTFVGLLAHGAPGCPLELTTSWTRQ